MSVVNLHPTLVELGVSRKVSVGMRCAEAVIKINTPTAKAAYALKQPPKSTPETYLKQRGHSQLNSIFILYIH